MGLWSKLRENAPPARSSSEIMTTLPAPGHVTVVGCAANGQPRTYRLSRPAARESAYRRLAAAILGLDISTLAVELRAARLSIQEPRRSV
jgi:hypothetical protein